MGKLKTCPFCGGEANFFLTASGKKDMIDYAAKNNWNLQEPSDYSIEGYLYDGKPEIDEVMKRS